MKIILNRDDTEEALDHLHELAEDLRREHHELRARYITDRDGYPTSSMGGGGSPTNELDDDGTPLAPRSDPTARTVVARDEAEDSIGHALALMVGKIHQARRTLESAISDAGRARPPIKPPDQDSIWCTSCIRADIRAPRGEGCGDHCRWCADWRRAHGQLPYPELCDLHARDIRITPARIAEVEHTRAARRRVKRKAKRR